MTPALTARLHDRARASSSRDGHAWTLRLLVSEKNVALNDRAVESVEG
jgi:hypothetical protein